MATVRECEGMSDASKRPRRADPRLAAPRRPQPPVVRRSQIHGRYAPPSAERLTRHKPVGKRGRLPAAARALLLVAGVALAGSVALGATGALGTAVANLGDAIGGLMGGLTGASPSPTSTENLPESAPRLDQPTAAWTNQPATDVRGLLPSGTAGSPDLKILVYVGDIKAVELPVPRTADFFVPAVPLQKGWNEISAALVGPDGEGPRSAPIRVAFDNVPPALTISAPKDESPVAGDTVTVTGKTQVGSTVRVRNENTGGTAVVLAEDGTFSVEISVGDGTNGLTVTAEDPAGNSTVKIVSVVRGSGELTTRLTLSAARVALEDLPATMTITVTVIDVGGVPVEGAMVTFSISPPGLPTSTFEAVTSNGVATWSVTIPRDGATMGVGFVTARVVLADGRTITTSDGFSIV